MQQVAVDDIEHLAVDVEIVEADGVPVILPRRVAPGAGRVC